MFILIQRDCWIFYSKCTKKKDSLPTGFYNCLIYVNDLKRLYNIIYIKYTLQERGHFHT